MSIANILSLNIVFLGKVPSPPNDKPDASCMGDVLRLKIDAQGQDNWCWAMVAVGVAHAFQDTDPQWVPCSVAKRVLAMECCPEGDYESCDQPLELAAPLDGHMDPSLINPQTDKTFGLVQYSIDNGIPIAVRLALPNTVGHFVVISGYCLLGDGSQRIFVCDPQDGSRRREDFDGFLNGFGGKPRWDQTYLTQGIAGHGDMKVGKE
jgi:hypothetical protein